MYEPYVWRGLPHVPPEDVTIATRIVVAAFAEAIAAPGSPAMLIDERNRNAGFVPIEHAVRTRRAFAVRLRSGIVAFDLDEPNATTTVSRLLATVKRHRLSPVVVRSGRRHNRHVFARVADRVHRADLEAWGRIEGLDVRGPGQLIRPPLAPHRLPGINPALLEPNDATEALRRLIPKNTGHTSTPDLRSTALHFVGSGIDDGRFRSRSEALYNAEHRFIDLGYSDHEICELILSSPLGEKAREKRNPRGWLLRDIRRARRKRRPKHPVAIPALTPLEEAIASHPWVGRHHLSVRATLDAHLTIARRTGKLVYGASERELSGLAGLTRKTVRKANKTATRLGFLERIEAASDHKPTRWRMLQQSAVRHVPHSIVRGGVVNGVPVGHDLFRSRAGLPKSAAYVYAALSDVPAKPNQIMQRAGVARSTLYRNLSLLDQLNLASRGPAGWTRGEATLLEAAESIGTNGAGERLRTLHRTQRSAFAAYLASREGPQTTTKRLGFAAEIGTSDGR